MSGNRFHNKYHNASHHTNPTIGDIDSAYDPIASPSDPFMGDFHLSGDLVVLSGNVESASGDFDYISVDVLDSKSGTLSISASDIAGLPISKITDVDTSGLSNSDVLIYNSSTLKWESSPIIVPDNSISTSQIDGGIWGDGLSESSPYINVDFATSGDVASGVSEVLAISPKAMASVVKSDIEFVALSSGTEALTQSSVGTYTYNISDFNEAGDTSEIRELHVECSCFGGNEHDVRIKASYPNDPTNANITICRSYGVNDDDDCGFGSVVIVPINDGQSTVVFDISGTGTHVYTIIGARKRVA